MDRKSVTAELSALLEAHINPKHDTRIYYAKEVTFDYSTGHISRVDYMQFKPVSNSASGIEQGAFYAYEIKSCLDDFKSLHGKNWDIADYNYLVTTIDVWEQVRQLVPYWVGCYALDGNGLTCVKKAKRHDRYKSCAEMLLMMFRSANRELIKNKIY